MIDTRREGGRELVIVLIVLVTIALFLFGTYCFVAGQPPFLGNVLSFLPAAFVAAFGFVMNLTWGLSRHLDILIREMNETSAGETAVFLFLFLLASVVWVGSVFFEKSGSAAMAEKAFFSATGALLGTNIGRNRQKNRHKHQSKESGQ